MSEAACRRGAVGVRIVNIHRGAGPRARFIYAELVDADGKLLISATLEYIVRALERGEFMGTV